MVDIRNAPPLVPKSPGGADKGENDKGRGPADDSNGEPDGTETDEAERQYKLRRVVYGMCRQARDKAKRHRAFGEWIGGGLVSHRDEAKRLFGDDAIVERRGQPGGPAAFGIASDDEAFDWIGSEDQ